MFFILKHWFPLKNGVCELGFGEQLDGLILFQGPCAKGLFH